MNSVVTDGFYSKQQYLPGSFFKCSSYVLISHTLSFCWETLCFILLPGETNKQTCVHMWNFLKNKPLPSRVL